MYVDGKIISKLLGNQRGQSLTGILVAIPVVVITSMLVGTMVFATYREAAKFKSNKDSSYLQQELREILDSRMLCASKINASSNLYNSSAATSAEGMDIGYVLQDGTTVAKANATLVNYGVRVNSLKFKAYNTGGTSFSEDPRIPGNALQYGEVIINTQKLGDNSGIEKRDQSLGGVVLSVAPSGLITSCFLLDKGFDLCIESGGNYDASNVCHLPSPCPLGESYAGNDGSGNPICHTPEDVLANSCPAGMVLISDGAGGATCGLPNATPTPTPVPTPTPTPTPTPVPTPTPPGPPGPTPVPTPTPTPTPTPVPTPTPTPVVITPGPPDPNFDWIKSQTATASADMDPECLSFLSNNTPLDLTSTDDITMSGSYSNINIPKVRIFNAPNIAANQLIIDNAVQISSKGATKYFWFRTQYLEYLKGAGPKFIKASKNVKMIDFSTGDLCLGAETVDTLDTVTGTHHIFAKSIGLIYKGAGKIHIYGATVNTVDDHTGDICLHNGAKIINYTAKNFGKVLTDCP